jgi:predicted acylesterase/phospholipase RssA
VLVALSRGGLDRFWNAQSSTLNGCELLVLGRRLEPGLFAALQPHEVHVVTDPGLEGEAVRSLARRLAGRALGLVLSGGGAAAFVHVGVVAELLDSGVRFDRTAGVSLGALVAAAVAADYTPTELYDAFEHNFVATNPTSDYTLPIFSLLRGAKTRRLLRRVAGDRRIEELPRRFFCISCDLVRHEAVVHRVGLAADAIYASLAIPGVFPPVATSDGRLLVDGGVIDNLPVARMARTREGPVVAVDVTAGLSGRPRSGRPRLEPLRRTVRRTLTGNELPTPLLGATIVRAITAGRTDVLGARLDADVVITPAVHSIGPTDWKSLPRAVEIGRQAARAALAEHPELASWGRR